MLLIKSFLSRFELNAPCGNIFCSTCGGDFYKLQQYLKANPDECQWLKSAVAALSYNELKTFDRDWIEVLEVLFPDTVSAKRQDKVESILDEELDQFIFQNRWVINQSNFNGVVQRAFRYAIQLKDISLIETLLIVFKDQCLNYPEFVQLALRLKQTTHRLDRALYNAFREQLTEVRDFIGDGSSF